MLAALVIVFREMIEAGLIVGIVLAATKGVPRRGLWVAYGVLGGAVGACLVAAFAGQIASLFEGSGQELFNASILLLAVGMLTCQHRAHPRSPPPPAQPPTAPGACSVMPEPRPGSPPGTTSTTLSPGICSAPPSGEDAPVCDLPRASGSPDRSRSAHSTSRSSPSLPITGVLALACFSTIHALWQTD